MLHFIIGREGTGKTVYTHKLLGKYIKSENAKAVLLVPKQFTFDSDKGILDALGPKDACEVEVLSFSRLADVVFKSCRGIKKPLLKDGANAAVMALALDSVKDKLELFQKHLTNISFIKKMLDQIADFKQKTILEDELFSACKVLDGGILKKKLYETALIYKTYNALVEQKFFDDRDVLTLVYEILLESDFFEGKIVAIDGFNDFSAQELKIIERIMLSAKEVFVTLCTDDPNSTDALSPFSCVNQTAARLKNAAKKHGVEIGKTIVLSYETNRFKTYQSGAIAHLEKNLYDPLFTPYEKDCGDVILCSAPSMKEECDFAACRIKKLMRTGEYRPRDIAVVYRSDAAYQKQIKYSLNKFGIAVFEDRRLSIENEPLIILVRSLLQMRTQGLTTENLMRYLKTGLSGISHDEISEVENYALLWDVGAKQWQEEWTANPDGFGIEMNEKRKERLCHLNALREQIIVPLVKLKEKLKHQNALFCMKSIYEFLIENNINENLKAYAIGLEESGNFDLALEQEQVWDILMTAMDEIANAAGQNEISSAMLLEIFDLVISCQSLGKLPDGYDEVFICDATRISTKMFKTVFAVGMNSGVFPLEPSQGGIFTRNETSKLRPMLDKLRDDSKFQTALERFYVYNTLCSAGEKLYLTWSMTSVSGEKLTESPVVADVRKILPKCRELDFLNLEPQELIESELPAFELMAKKWNENSPQSEALKTYFSKASQYAGKIAAIQRAAEKTQFGFENPNYAKQLFGKKMSLSASRLETYEECPFQYFCRYAVRANPREVAKLDPAKSGTIVHYVLETLLRKYKGKELSQIESEQFKSEIQSSLEHYIDKYMGGRDGKSKRFLYLYDRMYKTLCVIAERLVAEFSNSCFAPCDFELKISADGEIKPTKIPLDDGYIELCGFVDRVDKMDADGKRYIRVVDYKTGAKTFSLSDVMSGIGMQMLVYLISIWKGGKEKYGDIVPAGALYFPARVEPFEADRGDDCKSLGYKLISGGKMNGMILNDETVIRGMDEEMRGRFLPISVTKKTGSVKGNFISLAELGKLAKKTDEILREMGNSLHQGKVPAKPVRGTGHGDTCKRCDYRSVCQREEDGDFRYIEKKTHEECLRELRGGDGNGKKLDEMAKTSD